VGAAYAAEYCVLTEGTRAYRHMEIADVVRLLVAASRTEHAAAAVDNALIPTLRNECESRTADATLARARGDPDAVEIFRQAAELWRAFGHPLEEYLALVPANVERREADVTERSGQVATNLRLASESVAALSAHPR
jgi:hypothetical protein